MIRPVFSLHIDAKVDQRGFEIQLEKEFCIFDCINKKRCVKTAFICNDLFLFQKLRRVRK